LEGITSDSKPSVSIPSGRILPPISTTFLFQNEHGKAGQSVKSQLLIKSNAHQGSAPIRLTSLTVSFSGSLSEIIISHQGADTTQQERGNVSVSSVALTKAVDANVAADEIPRSNITLEGAADLTLSPGQTLVFNLDIPLREPGETRVDSLTLNLESEAFDLEQALDFPEENKANFWYISPSATKRITRPNPLAIKVLPRPPKLEVKCPAWKEQYYTDEVIDLDFDLINGEDTEAVAKLDVTLFGESPPKFVVTIPDSDEKSSSAIRSEESSLLAAPLGSVPSSKALQIHLSLPPIDHPSQFDLTIKVAYYLSTNPGTPISQTAVFRLNVVNPFEASYDLLPRIHPDPWPSFFDPDGIPAPDGQQPIPFKGLSQSWCLVTKYASFASEPLEIHDLNLSISSSPFIRCQATPNSPISSPKETPPQQIQESSFSLTAQRSTLDDRSPTPMDVQFVVKWSRTSSSGTVNTTQLPIPRFNLFGTEPRVLATVSYDGGPEVLKLRICIENASNHFLTFGVVMEPSEEFAFSGAKNTSLNLLPVQRRWIEWRILPFGIDGDDGQGRWIGLSGLVVRDKYYQKVLKVVAGGEGVRNLSAKEGGTGGGVEVWAPGRKPGNKVEE